MSRNQRLLGELDLLIAEVITETFLDPPMELSAHETIYIVRLSREVVAHMYRHSSFLLVNVPARMLTEELQLLQTGFLAI